MNSAMRQLVVDYAATVSPAHTLQEVEWDLLAKRLKVDSDLISEAVFAYSESEQAALWLDVLNARIKSAQHEGVFRQQGWQAVEGGALRALSRLLDKGMIKDPSELLAVAKVAQGINNGGGGNQRPGAGPSVSVQINGGFGGQAEVAQTDEQGNPILPGQGQKMEIDLSPRVAQALGKASERRESRIIDAERIEAEELRTMDTSGEIVVGDEGFDNEI